MAGHDNERRTVSHPAPMISRLIAARPSGSHVAALDYEIVQEQAAALGRLGRALEAALAALSRYDARRAEAGEDCAAPSARSKGERTRLVQTASHALWCFMVQREACGLRDERQVMREYAVPAEVRNHAGAFGIGWKPSRASETERNDKPTRNARPLTIS
jgi:hypothetical protein